MGESPHLTVRYTPRMRLLLQLLQARTGLKKAALVQLGLLALAEQYGIKTDTDQAEEPPNAAD